MQDNIATRLFQRQMESSEQFRAAFANLANSQTRKIQYQGFSYTLQLNPARIKSSTANIQKPLDEKACFLCVPNMPEYQIKENYDEQFLISVNPFPILQNHLTIISRQHTPQSIHGHSSRLMRLSSSMPGMCVFYNSPKSGASAPFHCHFQAGEASKLPVFMEFDSLIRQYSINSANGIHIIKEPTRGIILIESADASDAAHRLQHVLEQISLTYGMEEPEANLGVVYTGDRYRIAIFPREKHRPSEYYREDDSRILVSPGFADMAGLIPCSRPCDYANITQQDITSIMNQVSISAENLGKIDIK
ncbi:MAG: DUF4922 domain-containing protein [Bacteroidales bacterium]|nr:DUF4922 domain-containing protein [Bacteroidales bacterium]